MWRVATISDIDSATSLLLGSDSEVDVASIAKWWIDIPVRLRQLYVCQNREARCVGLLSWAYLSEERHLRMTRHRPNVLHASEWNEGVRLWIMQLVTTEQKALWGVRAIIGSLTRQFGCVRYARESNGVIRPRSLYVSSVGKLRHTRS